MLNFDGFAHSTFGARVLCADPLITDSPGGLLVCDWNVFVFGQFFRTGAAHRIQVEVVAAVDQGDGHDDFEVSVGVGARPQANGCTAGAT